MARKDRRKFLTGFVAASAATAITPPLARGSEEELAQNTRAPSALPPNAQVAAAETQTPGEVAPNRIGGVPGSDFMVDVIKTLGIEYMPRESAARASAASTSRSSTTAATRCPSSSPACTRNRRSRWRHGYFKVAGKPLMALVPRHGRPAARGDGDLQRLVRPRAGRS